jgi:hypothetical protein
MINEVKKYNSKIKKEIKALQGGVVEKNNSNEYLIKVLKYESIIRN